MDIIGFYDLHILAKKTKTQPMKTTEMIEKLERNGLKATPTHFSAHGIKTNATMKEMKNILP